MEFLIAKCSVSPEGSEISWCVFYLSTFANKSRKFICRENAVPNFAPAADARSTGAKFFYPRYVFKSGEFSLWVAK
jgi:hypothetical protein